MKQLVWHLGLGLLVFSATAMADCHIRPENYLVFSQGNITAQSGDFQGLTGATGNVDVTHFAFNNTHPDVCANLISGDNVLIHDGGSDGGNIEARSNVCIDNGHVSIGEVISGGFATCPGATPFNCDDGYGGPECTRINQTVTGNVWSLGDAAQYFVEKSASCRDVSDQTPINGLWTVASMGELQFYHQAGPGVQVFDVSSCQIRESRGLGFHGDSDPNQLFVVNIHGENISLDDISFFRLGVDAGQVVLNFPDAREIVISHTPYDAGLGIAATILAPQAHLLLDHALITGGVYVGSLDDIHGQVNEAPTHLDEVCH